MAYVAVTKKGLSSILGVCGMISPSRSDVELFTYTRIIFTADELNISCLSNNGYYQAQYQTNKSDLNERIPLLVKTDMLAQAVKLFNDEEITIEINQSQKTLVVQGAKSKHTLRFTDDQIEEFRIPEPSAEAEIELTLSGEELLNANKIAMLAVGQPKVISQPQFLHICYTVDPMQNRLLVVATDRHRVSKTTIKHAMSTSLTEVKNYLISPKSLQLLSSIAAEEEITIRFEQNHIWFQTQKHMLTFNYGDGNYPDYNRVIPQSFACSFNIDTAEMQNALKQVYLSARANQDNKSVTLTVKPADNKLVLSAKTEDGYASESTVDIDRYEGVQDSWDQSFNAGYLTDYINSIQTDTFQWEANPGKPSVLSPEQGKDSQMYLVSGLK